MAAEIRPVTGQFSSAPPQGTIPPWDVNATSQRTYPRRKLLFSPCAGTLAAAHLELVLAHDYDEAGEPNLALRSRISAASCLWSSGDIEQGRQALERLQVQYPAQTTAIAEVMTELARDYPASRNKN